MALNAYMTITGETNGKVEGGVTQAGREGSILIFDVKHSLVAPCDAATGIPTGERQHKPIIVIKPVDKSSPVLYNILTNNENITEWRLDFWRPSRAGKEFQFYTIELTNAALTGIHLEVPNNRYEELEDLPEMERLSFCYQTIIWTWQDGGITSSDDWDPIGR